MNGLFVTFEGVEGSGKSTQVQRLSAHLESRGRKVEVMREPGGTPISEAIRGILLDPANTAMAPAAELMLYEAARAQLVAERIRPALEAGNIVVCDRYVDSTIAYQGGGRGIPVDVLRSLHNIATGALWPHVTILLDLPVEDGLQRARSGKDPDRIEQENIAFHQRVREAFLKIAENEPDRVYRIDATESLDTVAAGVIAAVDGALQRR